MRRIMKHTMLVRVPSDLSGVLTTDELPDGWGFLRSDDARLLVAKIKANGWQYMRVCDSLLRGGVGETSQAAIVSALKLALRQVSGILNAVKIERIDLTEYPWFYLARVSLYPCRIQGGVILPVAKEEIPLPLPRRERRLPFRLPELYPNFVTTMPLMKQMLVLSRSPENRQQG